VPKARMVKELTSWVPPSQGSLPICSSFFYRKNYKFFWRGYLSFWAERTGKKTSCGRK